MDCVLMAEQLAAGRLTLGFPPPPVLTPWMVELSKWVRSQPLLMTSKLLSGTRLIEQTYHPKIMGRPGRAIIAVQTYTTKPMGRPAFPILATRGSMIPV